MIWINFAIQSRSELDQVVVVAEPRLARQRPGEAEAGLLAMLLDHGGIGHEVDDVEASPRLQRRPEREQEGSDPRPHMGRD